MKKTPKNKANKFYLQMVPDHIYDETATERGIINRLHEMGFIQGARPGRLPKEKLEKFIWRLVYYMHNYKFCNSDEAITINWDLYLKLVADLIFQPVRKERDIDEERKYAKLFLEFIDLYYLGGYPSYALILLYQYTSNKKDTLNMAKTFKPKEDLGWAAEFILSLPVIDDNLLIS